MEGNTHYAYVPPPRMQINAQLYIKEPDTHRWESQGST